jgi:hypothetical protein
MDEHGRYPCMRGCGRTCATAPAAIAHTKLCKCDAGPKVFFFALNRRGDLHAIDATPARLREVCSMARRCLSSHRYNGPNLPAWPRPDATEQTASMKAAEADAVLRLQQGEVATMEGVYALLTRLSRSDQESFPASVSVQPKASPFAAFDQNHDAYLVSRRLRADDSRTCRRGPEVNTVSVTFQSLLNGECWWDPQNPSSGVSARPMVQKSRSGESAGQVHGYRGRQYTLVQRRLPDGPAARHKNAKCSLVQIWKEASDVPVAAAAVRSSKRSTGGRRLPG